MAEPEAATSNKRKGSPELAAEDAIAKRTKLEDGAEDTSVSGGADNEPKESRGAGKERDETRTRRSPPNTHAAEAEREPQHPPEARRPSANGGFPSRRNVSLEEKKRGQRLFGSLVSTLSRTASGSQQQKRLEIERRQQEKAQQRRAEDEQRRVARLDELRRTRQIEQIKLEEKAMWTRHSTLLTKARCLQTKSEPKLYYLPWKPTREQEDIINEQIRTTEEATERETRDFKGLKERRLKGLGVVPQPRSPSPPQQQQQQPPEPEPQSKEVTVGEPPPQDAHPDTIPPPPSKARNHHHDKDHDENGDEMMQDAEDTVIY